MQACWKNILVQRRGTKLFGAHQIKDAHSHRKENKLGSSSSFAQAVSKKKNLMERNAVAEQGKVAPLGGRTFQKKNLSLGKERLE